MAYSQAVWSTCAGPGARQGEGRSGETCRTLYPIQSLSLGGHCQEDWPLLLAPNAIHTPTREQWLHRRAVQVQYPKRGNCPYNDMHYILVTFPMTATRTRAAGSTIPSTHTRTEHCTALLDTC